MNEAPKPQYKPGTWWAHLECWLFNFGFEHPGYSSETLVARNGREYTIMVCNRCGHASLYTSRSTGA